MRIVRGLVIVSAWMLAGCGSSITAGDSTGTSVKEVPPAPVVFGASISGDCVELFPLASGASGELTCPDFSGEDPPLKLYGGRTVGSVVGSLFRMGPGYRFVSVEPATDVRLEVIDDEWLLVESPGTQEIVIRVQSDGAVMACDVGLPTICGPDPATTSPVVYDLQVAGNCFALFEVADVGDVAATCPDISQTVSPIELLANASNGEVDAAVFRLGEGYSLESLESSAELRVKYVSGGWLLIEGTYDPDLLATIRGGDATLQCRLNPTPTCAAPMT